MFWGLALDCGKKYAKTVETPFRVSQATLDTTTADENEIVRVMVEVDDTETLLCNLSLKHKILNCNLDLQFLEGENIALYAYGKSGQVHLSGYIIPEEGEEESLLGEEEDSDEVSNETEVPELVVASKSGKRKPDTLDNLIPTKKSKTTEIKSVKPAITVSEMVENGVDEENAEDEEATDEGEEEEDSDEEMEDEDEEMEDDGDEDGNEEKETDKTPKPEVKTPKPEVKTPKAEAKTPKPKTEVKTPKPEVKTPKAEVKTPKPKPEVKTPKPEVKTPKPEVKTIKAEAKTPKIKPEAKTPKPEVKTPNPKPEAKTPKPEVKTPNSTKKNKKKKSLAMNGGQ